MRLAEFRIKYFRSIIDSGWNTLPTDNITALIGQNESGKTSVLEALYSYREGTISEDVLRSDMTFPEVSCSYSLAADDTFDIIDKGRIPEEVLSSIQKSGILTLTRKWMPDMTSQVIVSGDNISGIFDKIERNELSLFETTKTRIERILRETVIIREETEKLEKNAVYLDRELQRITRKQAKLGKLLKRKSEPDKQVVLKREAEEAQNEHNEICEKIRTTEIQIIENRDKLADNHYLRENGEKCLKLLSDLDTIKPELENAYRDLSEVEDNMSLLTGEKEIKAGELKLYEAKENYITLSRRMESLREMAGISIRFVKNMTEGKGLIEAEKDAGEDFAAINSMFTREETGEAFFSCVPRHEFFEDFSSLLPNRIDLKDIFENNKKIEGYKAVKNFLIVAGLDPKFFKQTNNRILKQKIENLNNEVTVDFQEYWRQNIGNDNKIKIHFELEHYDVSHPEKKGRPYLEFWIKDEHERLYPKQRSRGVRWFLSFYLELKAFAKENRDTRRILLIDEPGLSLHARAQEDVLKVFEDIREQVQIIYTTHSPHLIDHDKLYRLLAVQRSRQNGEQSETLIFGATDLRSATSDTLSPVSSLLGTGFNRQKFAHQTKNVIVEDICCYYYLSSLCKLVNKNSEISFLPANGPAGVSTLVNLLIGWGYDFSVLLFDNPDNQELLNDLRVHLAGFESGGQGSRIMVAKKIEAPEDIFSTLDFKKHVIKKRIGIADSNSGFIRDNDISRPLLASEFARAAATGDITCDSFDEETIQNLEHLFMQAGEKFMILGETV